MRYNPECGEQAFYYFDDITVKIALDASDVSPVRVALPWPPLRGVIRGDLRGAATDGHLYRTGDLSVRFH